MITKDKLYMENVSLIKQYSILYVDFLNKKVDKSKIYNFKKEIETRIPKEVINCINFFAKLDYKFKKYGKRPELTQIGSKIFSPNYIKNKNWEGYWLKATGMDCNLFTNWLTSSMEYEEYHDCNLENVYLEAHPKENYIPYSIKMANIIFTKYYK